MSRPGLVFRMRLTTPAMASEPYWAEAPSVSTCTLCRAKLGIMFRSGAWEPALLPAVSMNPELWKRLPFNRIRVKSGERLYSERGWMNSGPSAAGRRFTSKPGEISASVWPRLVLMVEFTVWAE